MKCQILKKCNFACPYYSQAMVDQTTSISFISSRSAIFLRGKAQVINYKNHHSISLIFEKMCISSCMCIIISAFFSGTKAVKSLPKPHSVSAHKQCYAKANYSHSTTQNHGKIEQKWRQSMEGGVIK